MPLLLISPTNKTQPPQGQGHIWFCSALYSLCLTWRLTQNGRAESSRFMLSRWMSERSDQSTMSRSTCYPDVPAASQPHPARWPEGDKQVSARILLPLSRGSPYVNVWEAGLTLSSPHQTHGETLPPTTSNHSTPTFTTTPSFHRLSQVVPRVY